MHQRLIREKRKLGGLDGVTLDKIIDMRDVAGVYETIGCNQ
jgi:hypothetical protein